MIDVTSRGDEYLMEKADKAINELVVPKFKLQKAYNYYNGMRDAEQFRYLEENFGIGNPTSIQFTPLIRKHVDALIGEYLNVPILPKVTCKDKETVSKITRDKEIAISKQVFEFLQGHLNNSLLSFIDGKTVNDKAIDTALKKLIEDIDKNFISDYEVAAQDVIQYILQSRSADLVNKLKSLLLDLLVTGTCYYKVVPSVEGNNLSIEVLNPLNTFVDRNPESIYVKDSYRVVVRRWMTKQQILNKYGSELNREAIKELKTLYEGYSESSYMYVRSFTNAATGAPLTDGLEAGKEVVPGFPYDYYNTYSYKLLPVYEVEWTDTDKVDGEYIMNRYETVKISNSIYILRGKADNVIRSKDNPSYCTLSVNGIFYINRNAMPYSLVEACMHLQDKYDIITFFRDNVIANSGTAGDWLDLSTLPTLLGDDLAERIEKWIAYKKSGIAVIDTSQEGRAFNSNTTFAGFDDTIKAQTIEAFELALDRIENTCSSITGVFRERLNGIQSRDAVTNVQVGIQNSYTITKQYYQQMDTLTVDMLIDCLNVAKIVWKKGLTGTLILGDKLQRVFTALPEHFTVTDYDIHITASSDIMNDMKTIQQVVFEFIKSGGLDPDVIVDAITAKSMTDLKAKVSKAFKDRKEEANQMAQLQQQIEQAQQQMKALQSENEKYQSKLEQLNEARLQIEREKAQAEIDLGWYDATTKRRAAESKASTDEKRTDIEYMQLNDGNPYNDKVRQI